jgi:putative membrane protein
MSESFWKRRYPLILIFLYLIVWVWAAINPLDRADWLLENYLIFAAIPVIAWSWMRFRLSNLSYTLIAIFLALHTIGSHTAYANAPIGFWIQDLFNLSRNHYDRVVHFSFGFLLAYPVREIFLRLANARGVWGLWFPVELTLAASALYEVLEWLVAANVDPAAGLAFLGSQGDVWDAQKDMALAGLGALIAMGVTAVIRAKKDGEYRAELVSSVRPRGLPLGEYALERFDKKAAQIVTKPLPARRKAVRMQR